MSALFCVFNCEPRESLSIRHVLLCVNMRNDRPCVVEEKREICQIGDYVDLSGFPLSLSVRRFSTHLFYGRFHRNRSKRSKQSIEFQSGDEKIFWI